MNEKKDVNELWQDFIVSKDLGWESQATLQKLLNEYPTEALERIQVWAERDWLKHDAESCLNAAAVGHPIADLSDVEQEIGVRMTTVLAVAFEFDAHFRRDMGHRVVRELIEEIRQSRSRRCDALSGGLGATESQGRPTYSLEA